MVHCCYRHRDWRGDTSTLTIEWGVVCLDFVVSALNVFSSLWPRALFRAPPVLGLCGFTEEEAGLIEVSLIRLTGLVQADPGFEWMHAVHNRDTGSIKDRY